MEKISRTKIVDLLKRRDFGAMVNVKGWVRTRRGSKQVNFIALNDGSTINNVQIVVDLANFDEEMLKQITTGACISVNGELTESIGSGQAAEVQARGIEVLGTCDNTYPLQKKGHTMEFLREIAHLRPRTNTFGAVFRIRHNMAIAIHKFFHERGFFYFQHLYKAWLLHHEQFHRFRPHKRQEVRLHRQVVCQRKVERLVERRRGLRNSEGISKQAAERKGGSRRQTGNNHLERCEWRYQLHRLQLCRRQLS